MTSIGASRLSAECSDSKLTAPNSISKMNTLSKVAAIWNEIDEASEDQRIDNYLLKTLKGVPKSHVYRVLRSGEVRVNSGRVQADYRLRRGDKVRIPPMRIGATLSNALPQASSKALLQANVLYEDEHLLALDKPAGMAVHGGSGICLGVIEQLRAERPDAKFLELVHRLDRDTSGCLLIAKKRRALIAMHAALRDGRMEKRYLALVKGEWSKKKLKIELALHKFVNSEGERRVVVHDDGQAAITLITLRQSWQECSLLGVQLKTGRTHQIRVHLAHLGHPIAGDDKYGDFSWNRELARNGAKRMFLHAESLTLMHPESGAKLNLVSQMPAPMQVFVSALGGPLQGNFDSPQKISEP